MPSSFTPGPWRVGREIGESQLMPRIEILRDVSFVEGAEPATYYMAEVCYPTTTGNTVGAQERRANARLIASAPELLEALQAEEEWTAREEAGAIDPDWDYEQMVGSKRRAAIAKATGSSL
jgi:hypothetical protein